MPAASGTHHSPPLKGQPQQRIRLDTLHVCTTIDGRTRVYNGSNVISGSEVMEDVSGNVGIDISTNTNTGITQTQIFIV